MNFEKICGQCHRRWKLLIPLVNCYHHWDKLTLNLFISELLITSETVEHQRIFESKEHCTKIWQRGQLQRRNTQLRTKHHIGPVPMQKFDLIHKSFHGGSLSRTPIKEYEKDMALIGHEPAPAPPLPQSEIDNFADMEESLKNQRS